MRVAAVHSAVTSADAPVVILFGIAFLTIGITAIVRPRWVVRNLSVLNPSGPPPTGLTRGFGVIFCGFGLIGLILGIMKLA